MYERRTRADVCTARRSLASFGGFRDKKARHAKRRCARVTSWAASRESARARSWEEAAGSSTVRVQGLRPTPRSEGGRVSTRSGGREAEGGGVVMSTMARSSSPRDSAEKEADGPLRRGGGAAPLRIWRPRRCWCAPPATIALHL